MNSRKLPDSADAGIVDPEIDAVIELRRGGERNLLRRVGIAPIGRYRNRVGASAATLGLGIFESLRAAGDKHEIRLMTREKQGGRQPNAARGSRNDDRRACQNSADHGCAP